MSAIPSVGADNLIRDRPLRSDEELGGIPSWDLVPDGREHRDPRTANIAHRDAVQRRALATADLFGFVAANVVAVELVGRGARHFHPFALLMLPIVPLLSKALGLYDRDQHLLRKSTLDELPALGQLAVVSMFAVWAAQNLMVDGRLGRAELFTIVLVMFGAGWLGRWLARRTCAVVLAPERCLVFGEATVAAAAARKLKRAHDVRATVLGLVVPHAGRQAPAQVLGIPVVGDSQSLMRIVDDWRIDRVVVAPDKDEPDDVLMAIRLIKARGIKVSVVPRLLEAVGFASLADDVDGLAILGVRQFGLSKSSALVKRTADVVGACVALLILAPIFALVAVAIKLTSTGPVLFLQPRIGRGTRTFKMMKFRSMVAGADAMKDALQAKNEAQGGLFKMRRDPRVTPVGRFLRATSLDELPQLLNVLKGDMSLVGPRPLVPSEDALVEGWQRRRLVVRPGMTGLWQIFGSARIPMDEMVKIDYMYGANWSLWLDLKILLRTLPYVLGRRGM